VAIPFWGGCNRQATNRWLSRKLANQVVILIQSWIKFLEPHFRWKARRWGSGTSLYRLATDSNREMGGELRSKRGQQYIHKLY
jgi:hypothetical protein